MNKHNFVLIIAGGVGTRLWPLSRQKKPKQFQRFFNEESLLQHMVNLVKQNIPLEHILVMATPEFRSVIEEQIPGLPAQNILFEPARKDNGPAVVLGMIQIAKIDPEGVVCILWSDQLIKEASNFHQMLETAFQNAKSHPEYLITVGAKPTCADTGLGYIQMGKEVKSATSQPIFGVRRFVEKPDQQTAKYFIESWEYLWNTGYKIMGARNFLQAFKQTQPKLVDLVDKISQAKDEHKIAQLYEKFPKESIEYLFTQYWNKILVIPADIGWSDVGNWNTLHDILKGEDDQKMVLRGEVVNHQTNNCLIFAKNKPIIAIGLENLIVVDEGDCLLIMEKSRAQDIKNIINQLEISKPDLL